MSDPTPASPHTALPGAVIAEGAETVPPIAGALPPEYPQAYRRTVGLVLLAAVGMYIMMLTLSTALSLRVATVAPDNKEAVQGAAVSTSALLLLFAVPLLGALSDRTVSRFGRRRPWIIGLLVVALAAMAVIGTTSSVPALIAAYIIGITAAQCGFNAYAVIPVEGVPDALRGRVMGFMGMFGAIAMSVGSYMAAALVGTPLLMMTAPVLLAILTTIPLLVLYKDPAKRRDEVPPLNVGELFRSFLVNPKEHPDFLWVWVARFLAGVAMTALFTFFIFFMMDGLHMSLPQAGANAGFLSLVSAPVSIVFFSLSGWLSDKVGRRKPFVFAAAILMAIALVVGGTATTFNQFIVAWLIFSVGQATYLTVDLALCAAVLPDMKDAGKDMAVFGLALNLPNILVPAIAPALLAVGGGHNYLLLWGVCAALCALGALAVLLVKGVR